MNNQEFKRRRSTILTAAVKDFSRLMSRNDVETVRAINHHRRLMTQQVAQRRGWVVDMAGDSLLAVFNSALAAVTCALDIQERLRVANRRLPREDRMCFRLGIDLGNVLHQGRQVYGDAVNIAARLQALAPPGGVFISGAVYHQVRGQLSRDAAYQGKKKLKNIPRRVRVYALAPESGNPTGDISCCLTDIRKTSFGQNVTRHFNRFIALLTYTRCFSKDLPD